VLSLVQRQTEEPESRPPAFVFFKPWTMKLGALPEIPNLDEYIPAYAAGSVDDIRMLTAWVLSNVGDSIFGDPAYLVTLQIATNTTFDSRQPPWWSGRKEGVPGYDEATLLGRRALLLLRDYKEWFHWEGRVGSNPGSLLGQWERDRTPERLAPLREAYGYFLYVGDHLSDEAASLHGSL